MISEKELDEIAKTERFLSQVESYSFKHGFRAAEKIYLSKIAELKKDIIEIVDLGTDQIVTEKITRLESRLKSARECIEFYGSEKNWQSPEDQGFEHHDTLSNGLADMINEDDDGECGGKRAREFLRGLEGE